MLNTLAVASSSCSCALESGAERVPGNGVAAGVLRPRLPTGDQGEDQRGLQHPDPRGRGEARESQRGHGRAVLVEFFPGFPLHFPLLPLFSASTPERGVDLKYTGEVFSRRCGWVRSGEIRRRACTRRAIVGVLVCVRRIECFVD